jgi:hypothetical protein
VGNLVIAVVLIVVIATVAIIVDRRRGTDPPTQRSFHVPDQLDRADFARADAPWLVAVFTSATCDVCALVRSKAEVLESEDVAVVDVEYTKARALHERYRIEAVPTVAICDAQGVVVRHFLGPMTATDLWAAVAEAREPGSTPTGGACQHPDGHD